MLVLAHGHSSSLSLSNRRCLPTLTCAPSAGSSVCLWFHYTRTLRAKIGYSLLRHTERQAPGRGLSGRHGVPVSGCETVSRWARQDRRGRMVTKCQSEGRGAAAHPARAARQGLSSARTRSGPGLPAGKPSREPPVSTGGQAVPHSSPWLQSSIITVISSPGSTTSTSSGMTVRALAAVMELRMPEP